MQLSPWQIAPWRHTAWGVSFAESSWRDRGGGSRAGRSSGEAGTRRWNQPSGTTHWGSGGQRAARLFLYLLLLVGLAATWYFVVPPNDVPLPVIGLFATSYVDPVPPNALAVEDRERMGTLFEAYKNVAFQQAAITQDLPGQLSRQLQATRPGGPEKDRVVVYVSGHGLVNASGQPCLLLPDGNPLVSSTWLPITELLEVCEQSGRSKSCSIVLLLDAGRIGAAPEFGVVCNSFAYRLRELLTADSLKHTVVINSTDGLDVGGASSGLGGSVFGFFAAEALAGRADTFGKQDGVITLQELFEFLSAHVDGWARANRGSPQRPFMAGAVEATRPIAHATPRELPPPQSVAFKDQAAETGKLLARAGELTRAGSPWAIAPFELSRLQHLLRRADQLALAGQAYREDFTQTLEEVRRLLRAISDRRAAPPIRPTSLAIARALRKVSDKQIDAAVEAWNTWQQDKQKPPQVTDRTAAQIAAWQALASQPTNISEAAFADAATFIAAAPVTSKVLPAEMVLLEMLQRFADWGGPLSDYGGVPGGILRAWEQSEALAASRDPRVQYWIAAPLAMADLKLMEAVDEVFVGDDAQLAAANQIHAELLGPLGYPAIRSQAEEIAAAFDLRDRCLAEAAQLAIWLERRALHTTSYQAARDDVVPLIQETWQLAEILDPSQRSNIREDLQALRDAVASLTAQRRKLLDTHNESTLELRRESRRVGSNITESQLQLQAPLDISSIWQGVREHYLEQVAKDSPRTTLDEDDDPLGLDADQLVATQQQHILWLATTPSPAAALLNWTESDWGESNPATFAPPLDRQTARLEDALSYLEQLGDTIRQRLSNLRELRGKFATRFDQALSRDQAADKEPTRTRAALDRSDILTRAASAIVGGRSWQDPQQDPAAMLERFDLQSHQLWFAQRAIARLWGPLDGDQPWFAQTARMAIDDAAALFPRGHTRCMAAQRELQAAVERITAWQPLVAEDVAVGQDTQSLRQRVTFQPSTNLPAGIAAVFLARRDGLFPWYQPGNDLPVRRQGLPVAGNPQDLQTLGEELLAKDLQDVSTLAARALFRGHVRTAEFNIEQGVGVEFVRRLPEQTSILVRGDSNQTSQIIVILDCSGSMRDEVVFEQVTRSRHFVARSVVKDFLRRLERAGENFVVGLMFYGHRAYWRRNPDGTYDKQWVDASRYKGDPGADVNVELGPVKLDQNVLREAEARLDAVAAAGETPLYYALTTAIGSFDDLIEGPRHIIAITDGVNDQTRETKPRSAVVTAGQVLQRLARENRDVRVDIIEFGDSKSKILSRAARRLGTGTPRVARDHDGGGWSVLPGQQSRKAGRRGAGLA